MVLARNYVREPLIKVSCEQDIVKLVIESNLFYTFFNSHHNYECTSLSDKGNPRDQITL